MFSRIREASFFRSCLEAQPQFSFGLLIVLEIDPRKSTCKTDFSKADSDMRDSFWYIKNCDLFSKLAPNDIAHLESQSRMRVLKRGETVYLPHQEADGVILVAQGRVKICHATPDGKQSILGFVDEGEIFGELALVGGEHRDEYVETTEKSTLVLIPKLALQKVFQRHPEIVIGVTKLIGLRRQRIQRRLRNLLFRSNRERVIHLLMELAEKYAEPASSEGYFLNIRLSHQEMACVIGSTRETVTVVLGQLQKEGLLVISRRKILINDLAKLAREVNESAPVLPHQRLASNPRSHSILQLTTALGLASLRTELKLPSACIPRLSKLLNNCLDKIETIVYNLVRMYQNQHLFLEIWCMLCLDTSS